ncbi:MAG: hypothetical protein J4F28_09440, partial [Nitrosopumilaceae archaeon]|nr:hypothetical protein [Nitrosopumilaceae archaeon]
MEGSTRLMVVAAIAASVLAASVVAVVAVIAIDESDPSGGDAGAGGGVARVDGAVLVLDPDGRGTDVLMPTKVSRPGCEETDG